MFDRRLPQDLRGREPSLSEWAKVGVPLERVETVLQILALAFAWTYRDALRLRPDDHLWPIYHHYYPQDHWWQRLKPDELELETLLRALQKEAPAVSPSDLHPNVTIGELVRLVDR